MQAELDQQPGDGEQDEQVVFLEHAGKSAQHHEGKQRHDHETGEEAEFLAGDGEYEVAVGVGKDLLDRAFAGAAPQHAAVHEGLERGVHLVAVAGAGVEETVDAAGDVGKGVVRPDEGAQAQHYDQPHPQ